jgi:DNA gyrase subunit A
VSDYQAQRRGGRGKSATQMKDEDFIDKLFVAHTHDTLLCFSNRGKVYWLRVFELPQGPPSRGRPIVACCHCRKAKNQCRAADQAVR